MTTLSKEEALPVEITQVDRDAAAKITRAGAPGLGNGNKVMAGEIKGGLHDTYTLVQAFARHRLATLPPQDSSGDARPCGGCGATSEARRCIGCLHDFGTPESAWVRKHQVAATPSNAQTLREKMRNVELVSGAPPAALAVFEEALAALSRQDRPLVRDSFDPDGDNDGGELLVYADRDRPEGGPIDMILFCPKCGLKHVDEPDPPGLGVLDGTEDWTNPPHRSHLCRPEHGGCGTIWRPADVPTNGVAALVTSGKADTIDLNRVTIAALGSHDRPPPDGRGSSWKTAYREWQSAPLDKLGADPEHFQIIEAAFEGGWKARDKLVLRLITDAGEEASRAEEARTALASRPPPNRRVLRIEFDGGRPVAAVYEEDRHEVMRCPIAAKETGQ